jgi:hypothetical protein
VAVSPLGAVLAAHAQQAWNAMRRQTGGLGGAALVVTLVAVFVALAPIVLFGVGFGYKMGETLAAEETRHIARAWLTGLHAGIVLCGGVWGGLTQVVRFDWETFRTYPVSPARLFLAELLLSPLDLAPLLAFLLFSSLAIGLGMQRAAYFPGALVLALCGIVATIAVKTIVGGAKKALLRRVSLLHLALAVFAAGIAFLALAIRRGPETLALAAASAEWLGGFLPSGRAYQSLGQLAPSLVPLSVAVAFTLAVLLLAVWVHARVSRLEPRTAPRGAAVEQLWSFGRPRSGIARLALLQVRGTAIGRILVLIPLVVSCTVAILARIPDLPFGEQLARIPAGFPWLTILVVWSLLIGSSVIWNQYGLDRHGIKTLLLMPVPPREIVLGKLMALAAISGLVVLAAAIPLLTVLPLPAPVAVHALGAAPAALLFLTAAGHLVSVRFPRRETGEPRSMPPLVALLSSVLLLSTGSALMLLHRAASRWGRWGAPAAMLAAGMLVSAAYVFVALPALARGLVRGRERLVQELG